MQDLRLVGVHDDGEHVVLQGADGGRYRLRVDEALRAAVRRDRARLGQLQIQMEAQLRPRDIQARIRAGESAEDVAAAGGLSLDRVRRYEGPVLAERAHVAGLARRTPFGRSASAGSLDDVVVARLTARAVDPEGARWDAWREEEGGWTVQVEFVAGGRGRVARWGFDPGSRSLSARDDEARWLSEEEPVEPGPLPSRRLVSVEGGRPGAERVYDVEADGGVRTAERVRAERVEDPAVRRTSDLLDALDAQRGVRGALPGPEEEDDAAAAAAAERSAAPRVDALLVDPPPAHPADSATHEHEDRTVLPAPRPRGTVPAGEDVEGQPQKGPEDGTVEAPEVEDPVEATDVPASQGAEPDVAADVAASETGTPEVDGPAAAGGSTPPAADGPTPAGTPGPRKRTRSRSRGSRPAVPSWDDIMFGTKKD